VKVTHFGTYRGSAGPTHIIRCGALFARWSKFERGEGKAIKNVVAPQHLEHW